MAMDNETRLIDGIKGSLYDSLLDSIDDKFYSNKDVFTPPKEVIPYLEGKKEPETEEDRTLADEWVSGVLRALKRKPLTSETFKELLAVLPEPFRSDLKNELVKRAQEQVKQAQMT